MRLLFLFFLFSCSKGTSDCYRLSYQEKDLCQKHRKTFGEYYMDLSKKATNDVSKRYFLEKAERIVFKDCDTSCNFIKIKEEIK